MDIFLSSVWFRRIFAFVPPNESGLHAFTELREDDVHVKRMKEMKMKSATALSLVTAIALALGSAAATAQPLGYRHHHYWHGHAVTGSWQGPNRAQMVRTPGN
jgi:hypothetical protein